MIASESDYSKSEIRDLYVRRFKKDVKGQLDKNFPERNAIAIESNASSLEESAFEILNDLKLPSINKKGKADATPRRRQAQGNAHQAAGMLFKTTLLKAMLSSPMACLETVARRIKKLEKEEGYEDEKKGKHGEDIRELNCLQGVLERITAAEFSNTVFI